MPKILSALEFVREKAKFHSDMEYSEERSGFLMDQCKSLSPGIYFILDNEDILKVGKADGVYGLKGRMNSYRSNLSARRGKDHTVDRFFLHMTGALKNKVLQMFIYEVPVTEIISEGYVIPMNIARGLEKILSQQAKKEGHTMLLSGQD